MDLLAGWALAPLAVWVAPRLDGWWSARQAALGYAPARGAAAVRSRRRPRRLRYICREAPCAPFSPRSNPNTAATSGSGDESIRQLDAEALVRQPPGDGNSVAAIVWHISGNLRSRFTDFLTTDGEKPWRDRESEFAPRAVSADEVRAKWEEGWDVLFQTLAALSDDDLSRTVVIRGQALSVLDALQRSVTHTSYHVGQIVFLARSLRGKRWEWLTIPPGQSDAYNQSPQREKP